MEEEEIYDDIRLTKRKTITNGEKYNFYIYDMMKLEKEFSKGKFGKGDTVISPVKNYKLLDEETGEMCAFTVEFGDPEDEDEEY